MVAVQKNIPDDIIAEVRSRTDIIQLISGHINLKKAGRNYLGLCPFHKEKTPSFTASPDKQIFYCFGCGEGGNAVSFVMKINSMSFPEAVRYLAAKAGVALPERQLTPQEKETIGIREQIVAINRLAATHFARNLFSAPGKKAWEYLHERGLKEETVRAFRLGYTLEGWRDLRDYLRKEKKPLPVAVEAGLLIAKGESDLYDRFRGRLMFPIADVNGRTIAFGGRLIGAGEPKYLNSPESPVYVKGRNLYGLSATREDIRKRGFAVVVEGYFDLLSLWNAGVTNVVATLGTALTREHVELIGRYTREVAVVFDPDEAGRKALGRSLDLFLSGGLHMKAVVLPDGLDPDEFVRSFGREKFEGVLALAPPAVEYYIDTILGKKGSIDHDRGLLKEAVSFVARIESLVERNLFIRRIAERIGIDEAVLKEEISGLTEASSAPPTGPKTSGTINRLNVDTAELNLIRMMLEHPERAGEIQQENVLAFFTSESLKAIGLELMQQLVSGKRVDPVSFVEQLEGDALKKHFLQHMVNGEACGSENFPREFSDTMLSIKKRWYKEKKRQLHRQIVKAQEEGKNALCDDLLKEINRLLNEEKASLI